MSDLSDRLRAAVEVAYGAASASRVARVADVNLRRAQYWLRGDEEPPSEVVERIERIAEIRAETTPETDLAALIERWREAGLDDEAIASILSDAHDVVAGRKIS